MPPGWIKPALLAGLAALYLALGSFRLGPLPPLGRFLDPFAGFWANAEAPWGRESELAAPGLHQPVWVVYDKRRVPHLFAQNDHDLFFAQGWVTARDRLWQMEIQTHAAAGRLCEILGADLLERDLFQRRLGMLHSARGDMEVMRKDKEAWAAAEAYADGVNAYAAGLGRADLPIEYKLLDYRPEPWTPLKTLLLVKNMQWTLTGISNDLPMTSSLNKLGPGFMRKFFPLSDTAVPPVIPADPGWNAPDTAVAVPAPPPPAAPDSGPPHPLLPQSPDPGNGSNNFVLSGSRTRSGKPLLANDPHLDLSLPSIWYEIQLTAPGLDAYGASFPGGPGLIVGFNRSIVHGLTNGSDDVFDWYRVEFRDSTLAEYRHGGEWKPARRVVETVKVRGGRTVHDTVVYTHHGPVVLKTLQRPPNRNTPILHALRWQAHEPADQILALLRILKAKDYAEFAEALPAFHCPAQNVAFAAGDGDIAMEHQGRFPLKWRGQGRFILDGTDPAHDWRGWLPMEKNPRSRNPERGWLASANQQPVDSTYPFYLGDGWFNGARARRLAYLMERSASMDLFKAWNVMLDDFNLHAAAALPALLSRLEGADLGKDSAFRDTLAAWDFRHRPPAFAPALFDQWWRLFYKAVWQDDFGADTAHYQWPSKERTLRLMLEEPGEDWFDDVTTASRETFAVLARRTFHETCAKLRLGPFTWGGYRPVHVRHLALLEPFSRRDLVVGGCADCVNAQKAHHGPSWRMAVQPGRTPEALGIYPGGQSGNPGSPHYDDFIDAWASGKAYRLLFLEGPKSDTAVILQRLLLKEKG